MSYYIAGQDWITVPYREEVRNGRKVAVYIDNLGELEQPIKVYVKAGESKTATRTIQRTIRTYQSSYSINTSDITRWW